VSSVFTTFSTRERERREEEGKGKKSKATKNLFASLVNRDKDPGALPIQLMDIITQTTAFVLLN
jgi:hypothetical protein